MVVTKSEIKEKLSGYRLFDKMSEPKNTSSSMRKSKSNSEIKLGLFVLKNIAPEAAAIGRAGVDLREYLNDNSTPQYGKKRRLMYLSLILTTKLSRPLLPSVLKQLSNMGIAMADCRRETLKENDMGVRNNKVIRSSLGFLGSSIGGVAGVSLMLANPYWGYFLGSQVGQSLLQAIPFEKLQYTPPEELPPLHTKYWGLGRDNDAKNVLAPLRNQYSETMQKLVTLKDDMYECIINYMTACGVENEGNAGAAKLRFNVQFNEVVARYNKIRDEHTAKTNGILKNTKQDDPERIKAYRGKLKDHLAKEFHNELVGLVRFVKNEFSLEHPFLGSDDISEVTQSYAL